MRYFVIVMNHAVSKEDEHFKFTWNILNTILYHPSQNISTLMLIHWPFNVNLISSIKLKFYKPVLFFFFRSICTSSAWKQTLGPKKLYGATSSSPGFWLISICSECHVRLLMIWTTMKWKRGDYAQISCYLPYSRGKPQLRDHLTNVMRPVIASNRVHYVDKITLPVREGKSRKNLEPWAAVKKSLS